MVMDTKNQDWRQEVSFRSEGPCCFYSTSWPFPVYGHTALCGFQKSVSSLNNQTIVIISHLGKTVKHGDIKCALNEGMPIYCGPHDKGRLTTEFEVHFSENGPLPYKLSLLEKLPEEESRRNWWNGLVRNGGLWSIPGKAVLLQWISTWWWTSS